MLSSAIMKILLVTSFLLVYGWFHELLLVCFSVHMCSLWNTHWLVFYALNFLVLSSHQRNTSWGTHASAGVVFHFLISHHLTSCMLRIVENWFGDSLNITTYKSTYSIVILKITLDFQPCANVSWFLPGCYWFATNRKPAKYVSYSIRFRHFLSQNINNSTMW